MVGRKVLGLSSGVSEKLTVFEFPGNVRELETKIRRMVALVKDGVSAFSARYGAPDRQSTGHSCSMCRGIWFGYPLEVTCPVCGNRRG